MPLIVISYLAAVSVLFAVALFSRSEARFILTMLGSLLLYLFACNIQETYVGIPQFIRYTKEPFLLLLLFRFFRQNMSVRQRRLPRLYSIVLLGILISSAISLWLTGMVGFLGHIRGVMVPCVALLYLYQVGDADMGRVQRVLGRTCVALGLFLAVMAVLHLYVNPDFGVPVQFSNRLDASLPYSTIAAYESVVRYQSFFGDPNRAAILFVLCLVIAWPCIAKRYQFLACGVLLWLVWETQSRAGLLAAVVLTSGIMTIQFPRIRNLAPLVLFVCIVIGFWQWQLRTTRGNVVENVSRAMIWDAVVQRVASDPSILFIGSGFGSVGQSGTTRSTMEDLYLRTSGGDSEDISVIDNSYLSLLFYLGLPMAGFILHFYVNILRWYRKRLGRTMQRRRFDLILCILAGWCFPFDALISYPWVVLFPVVLRLYARQGATALVAGARVRALDCSNART